MNDKVILCFSAKNFFSVLWDSLFGYCVMISGLLVLYLKIGWYGPLNVWAMVLLTFLVVDSSLWLNYRKFSKSLTIAFRDDVIEIKGSKEIRKYHFSDIRKVVLNLSLPVYFGGLRMMPGCNFNYALFQFKDGYALPITEFIDPDLMVTKSLGSDLLEKKLRLYNWIKRS